MPVTASVDTNRCQHCGLEFAASALFCPACGTARSRDEGGDPLLGTVLGERFLLVERLGHGASGTIYRAEHTTLRRRVAVKVLHHELSRDDLAMERFRREATTVSDIDNEHIVQIHDFGRAADGRLYLAMELLEGETLDQVLHRDKRLAIADTVDVIIQLGEALMEAHAMGYIHRDLRPRNIYLAMRRGRANFVKLLDFGLAKLVEKEGEAESTSLGMTFGDPKYMSPEQARGDNVDRRADIYSLGCIAYEMLVGQPPFVGGKVFDILTRHVDTVPVAPIERREDVPPWLNATVMRMLAKSPGERFITVYRLIEAMREGQQTGAVMADEVARRRESIPPPSVSRAMERLGYDPQDAYRVAREEIRDEGQESGSAAPETLPPDELVITAPDDDDARQTLAVAPVVAEQRRAAGKRKADTEDSGVGISGAWFADGEVRGGERSGALEQSEQARLERARAAISPGDTSLIDDLYFEPPRGRLLKVAAGVAGAALLVVLAIALWPSEPAKRDVVAAAEERAVPATTVIEPPYGDALVQPGDDLMQAEADMPNLEEDREAEQAVAAAAPTAQQARDSSRPKRRDKPAAARPRPAAAAAKAKPVAEPADDDEPVDDEPKSTGDSAKDGGKRAAFFAQLGAQALRSGDTLGAAGNFQKAQELDPQNVDAAAGLGEIALLQGFYADAIAHLDRAVKRRPRSARLQTLLGEAYLGSGKTAAATTAFRRALDAEPGNERARSGLEEATGS